MENFCSDNDFVFVRHPTLQSPDCYLFDDDVHINRSGGTAVFVSDINRAIGLYQNARTRTTQAKFTTGEDLWIAPGASRTATPEGVIVPGKAWDSHSAKMLRLKTLT